MPSWFCPLPLALIETADSLSFGTMPDGATGLPLPPHPGAFGILRRHHTHEGVDLYCPPLTSVFAVEAGRVVRRLPFTGPAAGSPWWHNTDALLVEGKSGVVVYGEIAALTFREGERVAAGARLGYVVPVLKRDKGRPMTMLHLELHARGTRDVYEWLPGGAKPESLRDPTPYLQAARPLPSPSLKKESTP